MEYSLDKKERELIRKELRIFLNFRYKKIFLLLLSIIIAYLIFSNSKIADYVSSLNSFGYLGVFIAGLFFAFGFTSPISAGFFITLNPENLWLAGILGGLGALIGDIIIFKFIRFSFMDEFQRLKKTSIIKKVSMLIDKTLNHKIKVYFIYAFAGIFIASPLPDEAAIIMLAGLTKIKLNILAIISFVMNTAGILILLSL